ncbi:phenylalanine--tRNA ligase subunit beta [Pandoraea apista]|uniref:Phenylalanine--tRNA ligase beta subunit n=1 Tax=Pandoraea apista TaxID=93218 RepID=A0A5E5P5T8_9BURK|nr:phenylalanine--tRNA ligase subunit beta [Pandoraea apista]OXS97832.1 phenylalanine--tRNA ligase subunit beta [Pandoraea apista]PTD99071.1 phenylalanine--tRNA ligase subunit beta [Pandoraea apista]RRJ30421.1 phenylalanine--tRNA ligase subunit beta [Pandoraea apista]RRJ74416.1 phenylalanine--tRNA ligase subunit beta [Pandoraea apista]RSD09845.1 phenylalanine--tRNA ligase subunit beta [Pandoraea apista]
MQFSESWLRTLVDPDLSTDALAHALTMSGLEVEETNPVAPPFTGVVVAKVLEVARHPDADRLNVCQVDAGTGETLTIVCGAPNVAPGIKVPCATVGAALPPAEAGGAPFQIKIGKLRGVQSFGMLCSARELKLSEDHAGLMILPDDAPVGMNIREYLDLDDTVFVVKLTPNKADCLSLLGIAREVAAITGAPLKDLPGQGAQAATIADTLPVRISSPEGCGRFGGRIIRAVNAAAPSPRWMVERLERAGQRSISALVDITNYVMLELGQPLHVYDLNRLQGGIDVRFGRAGETLKLLNEQTVTLDESVLAITDASGPIGLAGIMGGDSTKAGLETQNIFLEGAFFFPQAIQGRARKYNFTSDASHRFERGVDFAGNVRALERATQLVLEICGGQAGPLEDLVAKLPERQPVKMRVARAIKVLGVPVSEQEMSAIFTRLGLPFTLRDGVFEVTPPSYRFDIEIEEDLIEEIARIYGFDRIPANPPVAASAMRPTQEGRRSQHAVRHAVAARDYHETVGFSFVDVEWEADFAGNDNPIKLLNPIASHLAVMRSTLIGSLIATTRYNLNRKASRVRVFEIGRTYHRDNTVASGELSVGGYRQPLTLAALAYGPVLEEQWGAPERQVDFFDVKGDLEALLSPRAARFVKAEHPALHPGRSAAIEVDGKRVGFIGELHPRWQQKYDLPHAPVLFEIEAEALFVRDVASYEDIPKFPPVTRDIALVVDQAQPVQGLIDAMLAARDDDPACSVVQSIRLFDEFRPKAGAASGSLGAQDKSVAFRVTLQDPSGTLQDETVQGAINALVQRVEGFGARLRA